MLFVLVKWHSSGKTGDGSEPDGEGRTAKGAVKAVMGEVKVVKGEWRTNPLDYAFTSPGLFFSTRRVVQNSPGLVRVKSKGFWEYPWGATRMAGDRQVDGAWV